jgi:hypothetical protein
VLPPMALDDLGCITAALVFEERFGEGHAGPLIPLHLQDQLAWLEASEWTADRAEGRA